MIFYWFFYDFVDIDVFDMKPVPKQFLDDLEVVWGGFWEAKRVQKPIKNEVENR